MKVWVCKDALNTGKITETTLIRKESNGDIVIPSTNFPGARCEVPKGFWFKTKDASIIKARGMRERKILSLKSDIVTIKGEIERLEEMVFE